MRFYQQFIKKFFQIITLLTDLIKNAKKKVMHSLFAMTLKVRKAFKRLKAVFVSARFSLTEDYQQVKMINQLDLINVDC